MKNSCKTNTVLFVIPLTGSSKDIHNFSTLNEKIKRSIQERKTHYIHFNFNLRLSFKKISPKPEGQNITFFAKIVVVFNNTLNISLKFRQPFFIWLKASNQLPFKTLKNKTCGKIASSIALLSS